MSRSFSRSEGRSKFRSAAAKVLHESARATTKWITSDRPSDLENCGDVFPNLLGFVEDGMHTNLEGEGIIFQIFVNVAVDAEEVYAYEGEFDENLREYPKAKKVTKKSSTAQVQPVREEKYLARAAHSIRQVGEGRRILR